MKPNPDNIPNRYMMMVNFSKNTQAVKLDDFTPAQLIANSLYTDSHIHDVKCHNTLISHGFSIITANYPVPLSEQRSDNYETGMITLTVGPIQ